MKFLLVRTPRCGTSSFIERLIRSGLKCMALGQIVHLPLYDPKCEYYTDPYGTALRIREKIEENTSLIESMDVVYGHIPGGMLRNTIFSNVPWVTFMRDPVQFVISGWYFAKHLGHVSNGMTLRQYIFLEYRRNWQDLYVNSPHWYKYILTTDTLQRDNAMICDIFDIPYHPLETVNDNKQWYKDYGNSLFKKERDEIYRDLIVSCHHKDAALYYDVKRRKELGYYG